MKTVYINKDIRIHSELFNKVRLWRGLSILRIALEVNMSTETVRRAMTVGADPRPATVKKIGEYLGIAPEDWYVPREHRADETQHEDQKQNL